MNYHNQRSPHTEEDSNFKDPLSDSRSNSVEVNEFDYEPQQPVVLEKQQLDDITITDLTTNKSSAENSFSFYER
jgi:hypothetical protein